MARYLLGRALAALLVLWLVITATFVMIQAAPGGLSILMNPNISAEEAARLGRNLGLDRPVHEQYVQWLGNFLRGDLGASLSYAGRPVGAMVVERLPATLKLGLSAALFAVAVGVPLGVAAARHQNGFVDQAAGVVSGTLLATPNFWLGILLIVLFAVQLEWLPASGIRTIGSRGGGLADQLAHLVMPAVVLGTSTLAELTRYTRSAWLETMRQDYVRTARSKGLARGAVDRKHVLKNALIPVVTVFGVALPRLIGGSAVVETLFSWPGLGQLAVDAALRRDTPLILGVTVFVSLMVVVSNLVIDATYPLLDPRVHYS
ncbi:MAG: ABC transporter permease [Trueperaceae bacterium]|nr:ABC transporter permease [Trueperaceae bacterium]